METLDIIDDIKQKYGNKLENYNFCKNVYQLQKGQNIFAIDKSNINSIRGYIIDLTYREHFIQIYDIINKHSRILYIKDYYLFYKNRYENKKMLIFKAKLKGFLQESEM